MFSFTKFLKLISRDFSHVRKINFFFNIFKVRIIFNRNIKVKRMLLEKDQIRQKLLEENIPSIF